MLILLKLLQTTGAKVFYNGEISNDIISTVNNVKINPGSLSHKDLLNYKVIERKPVCSKYRITKYVEWDHPLQVR